MKMKECVEPLLDSVSRLQNVLFGCILFRMITPRVRNVLIFDHIKGICTFDDLWARKREWVKTQRVGGSEVW